MDPLSIVGGGLSSLLGGIFGSSQADKARQLQEQQAQAIQGIKIPTLEEQQLLLERLQRGESLTPAEMQAAQIDRSAFEDISSDPRLKQSQMDALSSLQGISNSGGLMLGDQANLQKLLGQASTDDKGRRDAIQQQMQERGMAGSGLELAQKLSSAQDASTRQNQAATDTAAQAQQNALQALMQGGQLGGQIRGQDFDQQARAAQARDSIAQFNAQNSQQANLQNTQNRQAANEYNTGRANQVLDQNTGISNQQQTINKGLIQSQFNNQLAKQKEAANATKEQASQTNNVGNYVAESLGTIGQGFGQYATPQKKKKVGEV